MLGHGLYFRGIRGRPGIRRGVPILEPDIRAFISVTHMTEVLFTDMEHALKESAMRKRVVPGSLVYCSAEGLCITDMLRHTGLALLDMEPKVAGPVFTIDAIQVELGAIEARRSALRPGSGLVRTHNRVIKQDKPALTYIPLRMSRFRPAAAPGSTRMPAEGST